MIEIRIKGLQRDDVKIQFESTLLSVTATIPETYRTDGGNSEYR